MTDTTLIAPQRKPHALELAPVFIFLVLALAPVAAAFGPET